MVREGRGTTAITSPYFFALNQKLPTNFVSFFFFFFQHINSPDPPVITSKPNDVYVRTVNEEVSMPCDGTGQPKPDIFWRKVRKIVLFIVCFSFLCFDTHLWRWSLVKRTQCELLLSSSALIQMWSCSSSSRTIFFIWIAIAGFSITFAVCSVPPV